MTDQVLRMAARRQADRVAAYRRDAQDRLRAGGEPTRLEAIRDRFAIGSADFVERIKTLGVKVGVARETTGKRRLRQRRTIDEVIASVTEVRGEPWDAFLERWGDPGAAWVMWLARRCTGLTLREIGAAVGGKDYAAVAVAIRSFQDRIREDPSLLREASKTCQKLNVDSVEKPPIRGQRPALRWRGFWGRAFGPSVTPRD